MARRGMELTIRRYHPNDKDAVLRITKEAWVGVTMAELRQRRFGVLGDPWQDQKANSIISKCERAPDQCFIAEMDGVVVGYATFGFGLNGLIGIVGDNAVDPAWQGRGIGTRLIGRVIEELEKADVAMLEVATLEHDFPARKVYERHGFVEIARTIHYTRAANASETDSEATGG